MKSSTLERQVDALDRLYLTRYEHSKAKRIGSLTHEEWQARKDVDIAHLEDLINGRKARSI
jgi:hypothetical protein